MMRKAFILWALAFIVCSYAQTISNDDETASTTASNLPSFADFVPTGGSDTTSSNTDDVVPTTTDDTTQPDSDDSNTDSTGQTAGTTDDSSGIDDTTQDNDEPDDSSSATSAANLPSFAALAPAGGSDTASSNTDDVVPTTTDDTTQPDSDDSNTDSTGQDTNTSSGTGNTTQDSVEPDDSSASTTPASVASDPALSNTGETTTTADDTTQPASDSTGQSTDTSSATNNITPDSDEPDDSSSTGDVVRHTADEASLGADEALDQNPDNNSGAPNGTDQSTGDSETSLDNDEQTSNGTDVSSGDNSTDNNTSPVVSTPEVATTNETSSVQDTDRYSTVNASTPFPQSVITAMSARDMRYHHYLWHQVREGWNKFTPDVQQTYTDLGWAPPNPARNYDEAGVQSAVLDNLSGEDFLYMHRQMIAKVNEIITQNNESYGNVTGWKTIPLPGDPDWPVPANYTILEDPGTENASSTRKTDEFFIRIQNAERTYKDPDTLRNWSLAEFGARMEVTIHAWLHMRFSENCTVGFRLQYLNRTNLPYIEKMWDVPEYNWLADTYSSQVFPTFYKIHGWVDDRIQDWMDAHNVTELQWNSTWTGGPWENVAPTLMTKQSMNFRGSAAQSSSMDHSGKSNVLEQVMDIFLKSGVAESSFVDDVKIPGEDF